MLLARSSSRRCSLRDRDSKKYEDRASEQPASGIWASEYVRGVSSISGRLHTRRKGLDLRVATTTR